MPHAPHNSDEDSRRRRDSAPDRDTASREETESVLESFKCLVQVASEAGRDWKLIDALLHTMVELVLETSGDALNPPGMPAAEPSVSSESASAQPVAPDPPRRRLRAEYRLRLDAVIDSWSDDETAEFLTIGLRQVRRRAQQGSLYYFLVNGKRRYPVWQFDSVYGVVRGIEVLGPAFPESWRPDRVYEFMTDLSPELGSLSPTQWLLANRDPRRLAALLASIEVR